MNEPPVHTETIRRDADNLAIWVHVTRKPEGASEADMISLLTAEIQSICNEHISTLDDSLARKSPRPTPTPHVFIEQGNPLSRILWLRWEP